MKPRTLGDSLVLRNATKEDIPALLEHFRTVHGEGVIDELRTMLERYPRFSWEDSFIIAHQETGEVVSCTLLLRSSWTLDSIEFPSVEMEAVGTLEAYRYRGHMRLLNDAFEERAAELQPVIQTIAGIPFFYRIFGYEYAAPLGGGYPVSADLVPRLPDGEEEPVTFEEVDEQNYSEFLKYRESHIARKTWNRTWHRTLRPDSADYLLFEQSSFEQEAHFFYLVKEQGKTVGSFYIARWEKRADIVELYLDNYKHLDAVVRLVLARAKEWDGIPVRVVPPNQSQLKEFVVVRTQCLTINRYAWYIKIPSVIRFIETMAALFEQRLKTTEFNNFDGSLKVTDYKRGYELIFEKGEFTKVTEREEKNIREYQLMIPKGALTRLLMGYETLDELMSHEPDVTCVSAMKPLVRALFPKLNANVDPYY
ncbi:MAG: GNAT family N-acetyltransferase [Candidatus Thorarchaeota archaeon]|nr:GNAT family N-acetyltransferase [Candidatus Thorarchaeota archaeon]